MSVAVDKCIIFSSRVTPSEVPTASEAYYWLEGDTLKYKVSNGTVYTLATGVSAEEVQDMVGALLSGVGPIVTTYNDTLNTLTISLDQTQIDHTQILNKGTNTHAQIDTHIANISNPHGVTKAQVGLANVDNTSDLAKPISTATQTALNGKENSITAGTTSQYYRGDKTFQTLDKAAVGLSNVDNTSDLNKPISTATQVALNAKYDATNPNGYETPALLNARDTANRDRANHTGNQLASTISDFSTAADARITAQKGVANGVATLDATVKIPATQIPALPYAPTSHTHTASEITDFTPAVEAVGDVKYALIGHTHADATTVASGFMSATDKVKLDGITNDVFLRQTATYSNTSNVTYVTCPQMAVNCVAGRLYRIKWSLRHTCAATTTGFRPGLNGTATGTVNFVGSVVTSTTASTTNVIAGPLSAYNTNIPATSSAGTQPVIAEIEGIFICTTSGTIFPQFLSEINGSQVQVLPDSLCTYKEII